MNHAATPLRTKLAEAGLPRAEPLMVLVMVERPDGSVLREYEFDYNDPQQRHVFAAQARAALEAGQLICTVAKER